MKGTRLALSLLIAASSLSQSANAQKQDSRIRPVIPYEHSKLSAPPGMVYVPGGTTIIKYSQQATDSNCVKKVSLSSFFIDKCEVTNQQYRQFVNWVLDSLAITKYLKDDDKFFKDQRITDSALRVTTVRRINWARVDHKSLWENQETRAKLGAMLDERGQIRKDSAFFSYPYLRAAGTNPKVKVGSYATAVVNVYPDESIWAKDLTNSQTDILVENYFTSDPYDDYPVVGVTWDQARAFSYWRSMTNNAFQEVADYMANYHLSFSLPSEAQWVYAAQQDIKAQMTMLSAAKNTAKEQAVPEKGKDKETAKSKKSADKSESGEETAGTGKKGKGKDKKVVKKAPVKDSTAIVDAAPPVVEPAANTADANSAWGASTTNTVDNSDKLKADSLNFYDPILPDDKNAVPSDKKGLTANFKQDEGDASEDGSPFTAPVMSYAPNDFGIYNMVGNVSEWCMDAYSPSTFAFVSDINPVLLYDADSSDSDPMKRKVVRGGSFLSNAKSLSPFSREYELQSTAHCYLGFRCVMGAPEVLNAATATRKKVNHNTKKK